MFGLGTGELILIFVAFLLLFGIKRLPALGQALGQGIKDFKKGISESDDKLDAGEPTDPKKDNDEEG